VTSVGFASEAPMEASPPNWDNVFPEGKTYPGNVAPLRRFENVSPGSCTRPAPGWLPAEN
jgi:hypothetical protein